MRLGLRPPWNAFWPCRQKNWRDGGRGARRHQALFLEPDRTPIRATLPRGARRGKNVSAGPTAMNQGTIVIFRIQLLAPSETFIVAQAAAMRRFSPYLRRLAQDGRDRVAGRDQLDGRWRRPAGKIARAALSLCGPHAGAACAAAGARSTAGLCALRSRWLRSDAAWPNNSGCRW